MFVDWNGTDFGAYIAVFFNAVFSGAGSDMRWDVYCALLVVGRLARNGVVRTE